MHATLKTRTRALSALALTLALLPLVKGAVIGVQWAIAAGAVIMLGYSLHAFRKPPLAAARMDSG